MQKNQKTLMAAGILFFLLLVSYKFSPLHDTIQLAYLASPVVSPFQRILTYVFMMIGIIPSSLLMLYTSTICTTSYPAGVVQYSCLGSPFAVGDTTGFFAYVVACIMTTLVLMYLFSVLMPKKNK